MTRERTSQMQRLRDELAEAVINGELSPGEKIDPEALSERYGCSRTPVREAIQQLHASGLLVVVPKRGTFVAELGVTELIERFEVMAELEAMAARLAARRVSTAEMAELSKALRACQSAAAQGDADRYYYENEHFHHIIYRASQNGFLEEEARRLHDRLKPYRRLQLRMRNRLQRSQQEHAEVVAAIEAGDAEAAAESLRAHVRVQGDRFTDLIASMHHQMRSSGTG
ncbi:GntR family transcriptional regulator [Spiribacter pallidus]|uniref:GntR family transcriptional regulator n=1 Tax=Spiribacter pallidus TaxID=1987936 RepID=UPI00349FDF56